MHYDFDDLYYSIIIHWRSFTEYMALRLVYNMGLCG